MHKQKSYGNNDAKNSVLLLKVWSDATSTRSWSRCLAYISLRSILDTCPKHVNEVACSRENLS